MLSTSFNSVRIVFVLCRSMFIIEKAVGPYFNWTNGQARFLYSEPENQ